MLRFHAVAEVFSSTTWTEETVISVLSAMLSAGILFGAGTRVCAFSAGLLLVGWSGVDLTPTLVRVFALGALFLLGPGRYSVDGALFGRSRMTVDQRSPKFRPSMADHRANDASPD